MLDEGGLGMALISELGSGESVAAGEVVDGLDPVVRPASAGGFLVALLACEPLLAWDRIRERFNPLRGSPTMNVRSGGVGPGIDTEHHTGRVVVESADIEGTD